MITYIPIESEFNFHDYILISKCNVNTIDEVKSIYNKFLTKYKFVIYESEIYNIGKVFLQNIFTEQHFMVGYIFDYKNLNVYTKEDTLFVETDDKESFNKIEEYISLDYVLFNEKTLHNDDSTKAQLKELFNINIDQYTNINYIEVVLKESNEF